jgi:hypothetical protein
VEARADRAGGHPQLSPRGEPAPGVGPPRDPRRRWSRRGSPGVPAGPGRGQRAATTAPMPALHARAPPRGSLARSTGWCDRAHTR